IISFYKGTETYVYITFTAFSRLSFFPLATSSS
uniref:Uncharacterized protein n=1 Tax=Amphimedon queenslandica TaxID=400682 RepID=A0A1X7VMQ3_AMPQE